MAKFYCKLPQTIWELKQSPNDGGSRKERLAYICNRIKASAHTKLPEVQERIFVGDNYRCTHCGSENDLTIDHIVSVYRGGSNDDDNFQTLCRSCNSRKAP